MLDGGLSRVPQPGDRRTARRPDTPRRQPDDQRPADTEPRPKTSQEPIRNNSTPRVGKKSPKKLNRWLVIALIVLAVAVLSWLAWTKLLGGVSTTINSGRHQAVLLANGQTYFGKLSVVDGDFFKLTDIFYVQSDQAGEEEANSSNMQLVKRGEEVFGPQDPMVISRDQVVYFENIKDDSQVSQLMKEYKANN